MAQIIRFESFEEYVDENQKWFFQDEMKNHFLVSACTEVLSGKLKLINFFNILDDEDRIGISVVHVEDMVLVYGDDIITPRARGNIEAKHC